MTDFRWPSCNGASPRSTSPASHGPDSERRLRAMIENSSDIIAVLDLDGRLSEANPAGARVLGWSQGTQTGRHVLELVHPDDRPVAASLLLGTLSGSKAPRIARLRLATPEGSWVTLDVSATNCADDPAIHGIVINAHDVSD